MLVGACRLLDILWYSCCAYTSLLDILSHQLRIVMRIQINMLVSTVTISDNDKRHRNYLNGRWVVSPEHGAQSAPEISSSLWLLIAHLGPMWPGIPMWPWRDAREQTSYGKGNHLGESNNFGVRHVCGTHHIAPSTFSTVESWILLNPKAIWHMKQLETCFLPKPEYFDVEIAILVYFFGVTRRLAHQGAHQVFDRRQCNAHWKAKHLDLTDLTESTRWVPGTWYPSPHILKCGDTVPRTRLLVETK